MKRILLILSILLDFTASAQIPPYVATNGLVAYWPFTGNTNDISGNGNNGVNNGGVLAVGHTGGGGDAYYFSSAGCATYIQANINTTSVNTNGAMTLSFWIKRIGDGCLSPRVMEFGSCSTCAGQILINWVNGTNTIVLRHYLTATNFITYSFANTSTNNWYHIVYTNDGTTAKYYLNGALVNTIASPNPVQLLGNTAFGRMNHVANDAFNGDLDDIGLWNRALTNCEVNNLYTGNASTTFAFNPLQDTTVICDSIRLDAGTGYNSYLWRNGSSSETIMAKNAGWYKVDVTNALGCKATDSTYISIIKPTITASKTTSCKGSSVLLTATGVPGSTQTLVDQFTETFLAPWTHNVTTVIGQSYSMIISGTLSDHCVGGDTYNNADAAFFYDRNPIEKVTQGAGGNAPARLFTDWNNLSLRPDADVYNPTHTYTYTLPVSTKITQPFSYADGGGAGAYGDNCGQISFLIYKVQKSNATYTWSANPAATAGLNAADINKSSLTVNPVVTTTYYVTVNDGVTSCRDSIKITVPVIDTSLTVTDPLMFCSNNGTVNFHAAAGATIYTWLKNGSAIAGAANSKDYTATQAGIYRVALTSATGCTDTSRSVTVTIYPQPVAGFSVNNSTQCFKGNSFVFTNSSTVSSGTISYQWDFGDGNADIAKDEIHVYAAPNTPAIPSYTVRLITTGNNGCTDTLRKTVIVNSTPAKPSVTVTGPTTICGNGSVVLSSSESTGNQWYKDGIPIAAATAQTFTANTTGSYTVISTVNNCAGDSATDVAVSIHAVPAPPVVTAGGPTTICGNGTVVLSSSEMNGNQWYKDGAVISGEIRQTFTANATGLYSVVCTVNNCTSNPSSKIQFTITPVPATPTITANGSTTVCGNGSLTLASSAVSGNQWYKDGVPVGAANVQVYTANTSGIYTVICMVNNCAGNASAPVTVNVVPTPPSPTITTSGPVNICEHTSVMLSSSSATNNQWYKNGSVISGANGQHFSASDAGVYKVAISDACGIYPSADTTVTVTPSPANIRYPSVNVQMGTVYPLQARGFGDSYLWTPSDGLLVDNLPVTTTDKFTHTQDYVIQIKTTAGCTTYDSLLVNAFIVKGILVPTAFSPNGDGLNELLIPTLINIPQLIYFRIYNKWGQLIFQSSDPAHGWDGTYKGSIQPTGNYIWMAQGIDVDGKPVTNYGQVMIIR